MKLPKVLSLRKPPSAGNILSPKARSSSSNVSSRSPSLSPSPSRLSQALAPLTPSRSAASAAASRMELEAVFQFMDTNRDGKVSLEEMQIVLRSLGSNPSEDELRAMFNEADSDGDGFISLDEFLAFNAVSAVNLADLRAAFHVFDLDGNGYISQEELHKVMLAVGEKGTTREDCVRMIKGVDTDGDGQVDFQEFQAMMSS